MTPDQLTALREAWIEAPFQGVTDKGNAWWIQPLLNAVGEIVDPDRTLREDPEVKRRGEIASARSQYAFLTEQIALAATHRIDDQGWRTKRDTIAEHCRLMFGVVLDPLTSAPEIDTTSE